MQAQEALVEGTCPWRKIAGEEKKGEVGGFSLRCLWRRNHVYALLTTLLEKRNFATLFVRPGHEECVVYWWGEGGGKGGGFQARNANSHRKGTVLKNYVISRRPENRLAKRKRSPGRECRTSLLTCRRHDGTKEKGHAAHDNLEKVTIREGKERSCRLRERGENESQKKDDEDNRRRQVPRGRVGIYLVFPKKLSRSWGSGDLRKKRRLLGLPQSRSKTKSATQATGKKKKNLLSYPVSSN